MASNKFNKILFSRILGILLLFCTGYADDLPMPTPMDLLDTDRRIAVGDRLIYQVLEEREQAVVLFVNDRGVLEVPLVGKIEARDRNCRDVAFMIKEKLESTFFHRATVLLRYQFADNSRGRVTLVGRIARPGPMNIPADEVLTVSGAILRSGGFLPGADMKNVLLKRPALEEDGDIEEIRIDVTQVLEQGNLGQDMAVRSDDIIVVPESSASTGSYYVTGAVNAPGEFKLPTDGSTISLSQAILRAGGFAKFANQTSVTVIRENPEAQGDPLRFDVNVRAVLEEGKRTEDMALRTNDIIRIKEVLFAF